MNAVLLALMLGSTTPTGASVKIGTHYTDTLAGLVVYRNAKESVLLDIGWVDTDGKFKRGYKALVEAGLHFCEAAPDDSYHRIWWKVGDAILTYDWGLVGKNSAVGRLRSSAPIHIGPGLSSAWPGIQPVAIPGARTVARRAGDLTVFLDFEGTASASGGPLAGRTGFVVRPNSPFEFAMGSGPLADPKAAGATLDAALNRYKATRLWAEGDWGDFLSPIENQLGNSKIYSADTGRLAHIVSRNWCLPDGQVLFCWDSFFNGLLSSLDDPVAARNTVRAILGEVTADGFVPNFGGRGWGRSNDRSQPPVGSYCVWKLNLRQPSDAFLKEVYPKLLRWHNWWFKHRDGNGDGLLEWGSETGDLQNAKFESGLDDSPMFDDGKMQGPNMDLDATDLNALWALDAEYLAKIAEKIGRASDAAQLRQENSQMARRMDAKLWNDAVGAYCYRYWTPKYGVQEYPNDQVLWANGRPGLNGEYFDDRDLQGTPRVRQDANVKFDWKQGPIEGIGHNNFSVRWTGDFVAPKAGVYAFEVTSDDGCRLWIDGKKVIDGWSVHGATTYDSAQLRLVQDQICHVRLDYFQAEGGASINLKVYRLMTEEPAKVFSPRLSPLNFYPLMADAPSKARARRTLDLFFRPDEFGGEWMCPTISRSDPAYPAQGYWRGTAWGPTNYLVYQALRRYATNAEMLDFAEKSVRLFMKNWNHDGSCHENFNSITGWGRSDPHYTWGALLCLIGLEQLCDMTEPGKVVLNGASGRHIGVHNLRLGGRLYDLVVEPRAAILTHDGKTVAAARGSVATVTLK